MRRAWAAFLTVLALTVAAETFVAHEAAFAIERVFGWNALYGLLACVALIVVAKAIGWFLKRPDTYYDD